MRSAWTNSRFSPLAWMTHAGPRHTPSIFLSSAIASRWAAMRFAASGSCADALIDMIEIARAASQPARV